MSLANDLIELSKSGEVERKISEKQNEIAELNRENKMLSNFVGSDPQYAISRINQNNLRLTTLEANLNAYETAVNASR